MVTPTKSRSHGHGKTGQNGTVSPEVIQEKMAEAAQAAAADPTVTVTTTEDEVKVEVKTEPNREERRQLAREELAAEREARWAECVDAAREGMSLARDLLDDAQREYDQAHSEVSRLDAAYVDKNGFGDGLWRILGFTRAIAGFGEDDTDRILEDDRMALLESELIKAKTAERRAAFNLKVTNRQYRIAKVMTAHFRMRHYNAKNHGYNRAAMWVDLKDMAWTPFRMLGYAMFGAIFAVGAAVLTVASAMGVVAVGAVALVAKGVSLVGGLFSWVGSWFSKEPEPEQVALAA